jgi:hypothetical protein
MNVALEIVEVCSINWIFIKQFDLGTGHMLIFE